MAFRIAMTIADTFFTIAQSGWITIGENSFPADTTRTTHLASIANKLLVCSAISPISIPTLIRFRVKS